MNETVRWLLEGDVSIQYQTHSFLLNSDFAVCGQLQRRIEHEGFGERLVSCRNPSGHWGLWYYQPKWTSTHYTLCDLKQLGLPKDNQACREMVLRALDECQGDDGGLNFAKRPMPSDIAIDGMFLDYASYFCAEDPRLDKIAEFVLSQRKSDEGFSWDYQSNHGDPHTTICVLEGLLTFQKSRQHHNLADAIEGGLRFLYDRHLCIDEDTRFTKLSYPYRYRYDLLRFLEFACVAQIPLNEHIEQALMWLISKQKHERWNLELIHPGAVHMQFESVRQPSRFVTLKALRILKHFRNISFI